MPRAAKPKRDKAREAKEEYQRFLETAKAVEASEAPDDFDRAFKRVVPPKKARRSQGGA